MLREGKPEGRTVVAFGLVLKASSEKWLDHSEEASLPLDAEVNNFAIPVRRVKHTNAIQGRRLSPFLDYPAPTSV
jgi:hypothetical protein